MAVPVAATLVKTKIGKWIAGGIGGFLTFVLAAPIAPFLLIGFLLAGTAGAEEDKATPTPSSSITPVGGAITKKEWTNPAPAAAIATSPFGYRCGTPAVAANKGVVTYASWQDGGGRNVAIIEHGGSVYTWYAHLAEFKACVGVTLPGLGAGYSP